jgi:hypothetical protein
LSVYPNLRAGDPIQKSSVIYSIKRISEIGESYNRPYIIIISGSILLLRQIHIVYWVIKENIQ